MDLKEQKNKGANVPRLANETPNLVGRVRFLLHLPKCRHTSAVEGPAHIRLVASSNLAVGTK